MATRSDQRIAELEGQVADLATQVSDLRAEAFVIRTLEETMLRVHAGGAAPAAAPRLPRHLHAVQGGQR